MNQSAVLGGVVVALAIIFLFIPSLRFAAVTGLIGGGAMLYVGLTRGNDD